MASTERTKLTRNVLNGYGPRKRLYATPGHQCRQVTSVNPRLTLGKVTYQSAQSALFGVAIEHVAGDIVLGGRAFLFVHIHRRQDFLACDLVEKYKHDISILRQRSSRTLDLFNVLESEKRPGRQPWKENSIPSAGITTSTDGKSYIDETRLSLLLTSLLCRRLQSPV